MSFQMKTTEKTQITIHFWRNLVTLFHSSLIIMIESKQSSIPYFPIL